MRLINVCILVIIAGFSLVPVNVFGAAYYIDNSAGNDSNSGRSPSQAWKTTHAIARTSFLPGDSILLKCGGSWHSNINITHSGSSTQPLKLGSYGICTKSNKPRLQGSRKVTNWTLRESNIYSTKVDFKVKALYVNGAYVRLAQHPNQGYYSIDQNAVESNGSASKQFLRDQQLTTLPDSDLIGADIYVRTRKWRIEHRKVLAYDALQQILYFDTPVEYTILKDYGYYLVNKKWMLDSPGEWYYDANKKQLYLWVSGNRDPNQLKVEAVEFENGIQLSGQSYVNIENLHIKQFNRYGMIISGSSHYKILKNTFTSIGESSIFSGYSPDGKISQNRINGSLHEGITVRDSERVSITNNTILDTGITGSPKNSLGAIHAPGAGYTIVGNKIVNTGYIGIRFGRNSLVKHNVIQNVCLVLDDCAAIYTWNNAATRYITNARVLGNFVMNAFGNSQGSPGDSTLAAGIYMDDASNHTVIKGNTVINTDRGLFLHNSHDNDIQNNTFYSNRHSQLSASEGGIPAIQLTGNKVVNNVLLNTNSRPAIHMHSIYDNNQFATFEGNQYWTLYSPWNAYLSYRRKSGVVINDRKFYDMNYWQGIGNDGQGQWFDQFQLDAYRIQSQEPNVIVNGEFNQNINGWRHWSPSANHQLQWQSNCSSRTGCANFRAGSTAALLIASQFSMTKNKHYIIGFYIRGESVLDSVEAVIRRDGPTFEPVGFIQDVPVEDHWHYRELLFKAPQSIGQVRLDFLVQPGSQVSLDKVSLRESKLLMNNYRDDSQILVNEGSKTKYITCPDGISEKCSEYLDLSGNRIQWPVRLSPFTSKVIVWCRNPFQAN